MKDYLHIMEENLHIMEALNCKYGPNKNSALQCVCHVNIRGHYS